MRDERRKRSARCVQRVCHQHCHARRVVAAGRIQPVHRQHHAQSWCCWWDPTCLACLLAYPSWQEQSMTIHTTNHQQGNAITCSMCQWQAQQEDVPTSVCQCRHSMCIKTCHWSSMQIDKDTQMLTTSQDKPSVDMHDCMLHPAPALWAEPVS